MADPGDPLMARELDEDDVRVRPGRGSRPRSKVRPSYRSARPAVVTGVDRGRFACELDDGTIVTAVKSRELGRGGLVVGDRVRLTGDTSGSTGSLARVVGLSERETLLLRTADDVTGTERPLVANADQLGIVVAAADPEPRHGFVDRCLIAAFDAGLRPLIIVTKTDLADPGSFLAAYSALAVASVDGQRGSDLADLKGNLAGRASVLIGHSGVGKSTLVNALGPDADRRTGIVNDVTGRGRHTSSSAVLLDLPGGGVIIDTPGVRSFGLNHVTGENVVRAFSDLAAGAENCPRSCSHDEPDCALDAWVAGGGAPAARLESLRRIMRSRSAVD